MLVKNDKEWCWCLCEHVGYPQKSIEDAVKDFAETYPAEEVPMIRVGTLIIMFLLLMRSVLSMTLSIMILMMK